MKTKLRDRETGGIVDCEVEFLDKYDFFVRVPVSQIKPAYTDETRITPIPQNWQFPGDEPKNVIGSSVDDDHFIFYLESDTQTRARLKHL
jgi:hypothetical protein